jgi:MFS family permease
LGDNRPLNFPNNFGVLFLIATLLFFGGWWAFFKVREPPDANVLPRASLGVQLRRAAQILRSDANYRNFLFLRSTLMIAGAAVPFYAIYVQSHLGGSLGMIGIYLATFKTANLIANLYLGRVSARWGYHRLMVVATGAGALMTVMGLGLVGVAAATGVAGWVAAGWLVPVFIVNGVRESGLGIAGQSLLLDIAPASERSLYLGFTNTFLGLVLFVASFSGWVVEVFGFPSLLVITLLAYGLAANSALRLRGPVHPATVTQ